MGYRPLTRLFQGVVSTIEQLSPQEPLRQWAAIECDLGTGVPLLVTITYKADSGVYATWELQPGEKVVFSRYGDMPWDGVILITGSGGGTAGYRGGEVILERY